MISLDEPRYHFSHDVSVLYCKIPAPKIGAVLVELVCSTRCPKPSQGAEAELGANMHIKQGAEENSHLLIETPRY